jgi:peptidoglycan/LPS O-acetylase OafA/YrhL
MSAPAATGHPGQPGDFEETDGPVEAADTGVLARRIATGDPLRAIAVLGVVALHVTTGAVYITGHLAGAGGTIRPEQAFTAAGEWVIRALPVCVYLFFALSGFLITRPFVDAFVHDRPRPPLGLYLRHRALRLFPAAWVMFAFVLLRYGTRDASSGELVSTLTLTESYLPHPLESLIGHAWSLKVELAFYLLVPVAFVGLWFPVRRSARIRRLLRHGGRSVTARRRAVYWLAALGAAFSLVFTAVAAGPIAAQRTLAWVLIAFIAGVALAAVLSGRQPYWRHRRRARLVAATAFVAGVGTALLAGQSATVPPWLTNLLATLSVGAVLWACVLLEVGGAGTWRWLDNPVLQWVGRRSYGIYLWHVPVMAELYVVVDGLRGYRVAFVLLLPLVLLVSGAVAELSWRLVESPALRLRGRPLSVPAAQGSAGAQGALTAAPSSDRAGGAASLAAPPTAPASAGAHAQ